MSLCKEIHLKLLLDPPINVSVVRYLEPSKLAFDDGQSCFCTACLGETRIVLRMYYSNGTEEIILSLNQAAKISRKYDILKGAIR